MGLFNDLFGEDKKKRSEAFGLFSFLNEQQDNNDDSDLDEFQKKEIRKGNYNSWNFEEEELEEDDYYYEDDK